MPEGAPLKKITVRVGLVALSLVLGTLLAEAFLGLVDPFGAASQHTNGRLYQERAIVIDPASGRLFRHRPNLELELWGYDFTTDALGMRGPDHSYPKPLGVRRVLFLGDSVVLGWGVEAAETFVELVGAQLSEATGD
ncbi:MAG: hypothetical protein AAFZ65_20610, partial [Planctomycetota bacterium]